MGNRKGLTMFIDSHCHLNMLDLSPYKGDLGALIEKSKSMDVEHILCVCVDLEHAKTIIEVANYFENVSASIGLHPSEKVQHEPSVHELIELADQSKVVAIGETGLDYYYNSSGLENMRDRFRRHIQAATKLKKTTYYPFSQCEHRYYSNYARRKCAKHRWCYALLYRKLGNG